MPVKYSSFLRELGAYYEYTIFYYEVYYSRDVLIEAVEI